MTHLKLNLYQNAIDSIQHAIEHYTSDPNEARRYKYTVLHMAQGILLLLKERLSREHSQFIFKNVSDTRGKTVDATMVMSRLKKIANIDLGDYEITIHELINTRNDIEHYQVELKKAMVDSLVGRLVPFLVEFCRAELNNDFKSQIGETTWDALQSIRSYRQHAIANAKKRLLGAGKIPIHCPMCQDMTASEQVRSVEFRSPEQVSGRTGYEIRCEACLYIVEKGHKCQECQRNIPHKSLEPFLRPDDSYCEECRKRLHEEFPGFTSPTYAAEVRRWLQKKGQASVRELIELVSNIGMHGPTGVVRFPMMLLRHGIIDYASDYYKERNEKLRKMIAESSDVEFHDLFEMSSGGFRGDERFVWSWSEEKAAAWRQKI